MAEMVLQRIVMPPRRKLTRLYCRFRGGPARSRRQDRRGILLTRGTALRTDTWFNAFFESYWREYTYLSELVLQLRVSGAGTLRLYRSSIRAATVRERQRQPPRPIRGPPTPAAPLRSRFREAKRVAPRNRLLRTRSGVALLVSGCTHSIGPKWFVIL